MSQRAVERALGRMITDEHFRDEFLENPHRASLRVGLELTKSEMEGLSRIPRTLLTQLCRSIDDRICRLCVHARREPKENDQ